MLLAGNMAQKRGFPHTIHAQNRHKLAGHDAQGKRLKQGFLLINQMGNINLHVTIRPLSLRQHDLDQVNCGVVDKTTSQAQKASPQCYALFMAHSVP